MLTNLFEPPTVVACLPVFFDTMSVAAPTSDYHNVESTRYSHQDLFRALPIGSRCRVP